MTFIMAKNKVIKKSTKDKLFTRAKIIALSEEGRSTRYIQNKIGVPKSTVHNVIRRYKTTGSFEDMFRSGRPRVTTKAEDQSIVLTCKRNRRLTAQEITTNFNDSHQKSVSERTVRQRLSHAGLNGRVAVRKPLLRPVNKFKRLKWAKEHKNWTLADWKKVLWTDESKFVVFGTTCRIFVRRKVHEKFHPQCMLPTVKHGGGSVMVWGCFAANKVGSLYQVKGILDQKGYHNILSRYALPSGKRLIGRGFVLQQDNDPKHTSKYCQRYLKRKESEGEVKMMTWPPQSPDLNPIELLWEQLDRQVRKQCPKSQAHLWEILQEEWANISGE